MQRLYNLGHNRFSKLVCLNLRVCSVSVSVASDSIYGVKQLIDRTAADGLEVSAIRT